MTDQLSEEEVVLMERLQEVLSPHVGSFTEELSKLVGVALNNSLNAVQQSNLTTAEVDGVRKAVAQLLICILLEKSASMSYAQGTTMAGYVSHAVEHFENSHRERLQNLATSMFRALTEPQE